MKEGHMKSESRVRGEEDDKIPFQVAGMLTKPRKADEKGSIDDIPCFYSHIPKTQVVHCTA
jgi:hypothetical protein